MLLLGKINQSIAGCTKQGAFFWGNKFCEHSNFHSKLLHNWHVNMKNEDSHLQSDANMGLLKYLKDRAPILYYLKQAENGRIFNTFLMQPSHLSQTECQVLCFSLVKT